LGRGVPSFFFLLPSDNVYVTNSYAYRLNLYPL
jgi:hypothetical protein